jgi:hypothetical protein
MKGTMAKKTNEPPIKGKPQGEHQVPKSPLVTRSISNKGRGKRGLRIYKCEDYFLCVLVHMFLRN